MPWTSAKTTVGAVSTRQPSQNANPIERRLTGSHHGLRHMYSTPKRVSPFPVVHARDI